MECSSGKIQHESLEEAQEVADQMKERHGDTLHPYWCGECFMFHTGHPVDKRVRKHRDYTRNGLKKRR